MDENQKMNHEIEFMKYKTRGAYHWENISKNIFRHNAFVVARYKLVIKLLKKYSFNRDKLLVLDVGCGDGALSYLICEEGFQVKGIDISELAIKYAKQIHAKYNTRSEFLVSSVDAIPYEDNSFDFAVCADVVEHVQNPSKLLEELKRITKWGGYIIFTTPIKFTEQPLDKMHVKEWFPSEFVQLLKDVFSHSPLGVVYSHPLFWYELYIKPQRIFSLIRCLVNFLSSRNIYNIFEERKIWKFFMMQTCVIENDK